MEKDIKLKTVKLQELYPTFCLQIDLSRLKEIDRNPETYSKLLEQIKQDIFENDILPKEDEMEFLAQMDYDLSFVMMKHDSSPFTRSFLHKDFRVTLDGDTVLILVGKKEMDITIMCKTY